MNKARQFFSKVGSEPFYPLLLAIYPVIFIYSHNVQELTLDVVYIPLLLVIIVTCLLFFISNFIYKSWPKAAAALGLFVIVFSLYGSLVNPLPDELARVGNFIIGPDKAVFPVVSLLLMAGFWYWKRSSHSGRILTPIMNVVSIILVVMVVWQVGLAERGKLGVEQVADTSLSSASNVLASTDLPDYTASKPDVYYLVFDRYAANNVLLDSYGYDNSQFYSWLRSENFFVAENALSNYLKTSFSMSATLNMQYHDSQDWQGRQPTEGSDIIPLFKNNATQQTFHDLGYKNYSLASWYWPTAQEGGNNRVFQYAPMFWLKDPYVREIISATMAMPIVSLFTADNTADSLIAHKVYTQYQLSTYKTVVDMPSPKFVMAHILLPHGPYIFNQDCQYDPTQLDRLSNDQGYLEHLKCATRTAQEIISYIKASTQGNAIIVMVADEGASSSKYSQVKKSNNWVSTSDQALHERANVLTAYYFPDQDYARLSDDMSSINAFRTVFDQYFNIPMSPLETKVYGFKDSKKLFDLVDITDRLYHQPAAGM